MLWEKVVLRVCKSSQIFKHSICRWVDVAAEDGKNIHYLDSSSALTIWGHWTAVRAGQIVGVKFESEAGAEAL